MTTIVITDHRVFYAILARTLPPSAEPHFWLEKGERTPYPDMANIFRGDPGDPATYAAFDPAVEYAVVVHFQAKADAERVGKTLAKVLPCAWLLFFGTDDRLPDISDIPRARVRRWEDTIGGCLAEDVRMLYTIQRVTELRGICAAAPKIGILLQHDPDPDAIASGLALRNLLGRNRSSAPMITLGGVTRPENLAMLEVLELTVETVKPEDLATFDLLACVDVQPSYFGDHLKREVAVVIDHHPEQPGYRTQYRDVRASYGATATILTEYLRAAAEEVNQKQATALLYGIKTDTLNLGRDCVGADLEAFHFLYARANLNALRRIERPAIPLETLKTFGNALQRIEIESGLAFVFLGEVVREDVIPQLADLLLQVEGADWAVAAGIFDGRLVASVRNSGYLKSAGTALKKIFGDTGSAGGHRSMGKVVVPLDRWETEFGRADEKGVRKVFFGPFLAETASAAVPAAAGGA